MKISAIVDHWPGNHQGMASMCRLKRISFWERNVHDSIEPKWN